MPQMHDFMLGAAGLQLAAEALTDGCVRELGDQLCLLVKHKYGGHVDWTPGQYHLNHQPYIGSYKNYNPTNKHNSHPLKHYSTEK